MDYYTIKIIETSDCIYFYAIKDDKKPIGCLEIIPKDEQHLLLHQIFTLDEYRHNGIATNLLKEFFHWLTSKFEHVQITLQVIPSVYDFSEIKDKQNKLIKWYKKFDFEITEIKKTNLFDIPIMKYEYNS